MPADLYTKILAQRAQLLTIKSHMHNFGNLMYNLAAQLTAEGNPNSGATLLIAMADFDLWKNQVSNGTDNYRWTETDTLLWINDNWPAGGGCYTLTMEDILAKVWDSTPLETFFFINYIDGMRAAIMNKEITGEKLAEIYRHFLT